MAGDHVTKAHSVELSVLARNEEGDHAAKSIDIFVGAKMKARRIQLGLGRQTLAEACGINPVLFADYESGKARPTSKSLTQISRTLGVHVGYFFEGLYR